MELIVFFFFWFFVTEKYYKYIKNSILTCSSVKIHFYVHSYINTDLEVNDIINLIGDMCESANYNWKRELCGANKTNVITIFEWSGKNCKNKHIFVHRYVTYFCIYKKHSLSITVSGRFIIYCLFI